MTGRVLIIDDEPAVRHALERALHYFGYQVMTASGGDSAYEILQHDTFDVVLLDIRMPLMSGDTLFLAIIRRWPELRDRIILMSGDPDSATKAWSEELRNRPILAKPFALTVLHHAIQDILAPQSEARPRMGNGA